MLRLVHVPILAADHGPVDLLDADLRFRLSLRASSGRAGSVLDTWWTNRHTEVIDCGGRHEDAECIMPLMCAFLKQVVPAKHYL